METMAGSGTHAEARVGQAMVMQVGKWEMVYYPSDTPDTPALPVLYLWGAVRRYWIHNRPTRLTVLIIPTPAPYRIGQRRQVTPPPFTYVGDVSDVSKTQITLVRGQLVYD